MESFPCLKLLGDLGESDYSHSLRLCSCSAEQLFILELDGLLLMVLSRIGLDAIRCDSQLPDQTSDRKSPLIYTFNGLRFSRRGGQL
jgi:hypothetical protein